MRDAVDVSMLQRDFRADEQHDAYGEIVWSWRPVLAPSAARERALRDTGARKPVPGESTYKR